MKGRLSGTVCSNGSDDSRYFYKNDEASKIFTGNEIVMNGISLVRQQ